MLLIWMIWIWKRLINSLTYSNVQNEVKPSRDKLKGESDIQRRRKKSWWKYGGTAHNMNRAISNMDRCLACSSVTKQLVLVSSPPKVFANSWPFSLWIIFFICYFTVECTLSLGNEDGV